MLMERIELEQQSSPGTQNPFTYFYFSFVYSIPNNNDPKKKKTSFLSFRIYRRSQSYKLRRRDIAHTAPDSVLFLIPEPNENIHIR